MPPASSRRAADVAPFARRRTRPPSRTGSIESSTREKEQDLQYASVLEAADYMSGYIPTWVSENDEPMAEMMEDVFHALERLVRRDSGKKQVGRSTISV
jgi:hypothetical protein